jgi:CrcB protein
MTELVVIGAGGALGAVGRYGLSLWIGRRLGEGFPYGTLIVNVLGCLALGALLSYVESAQGFSPRLRLFLATGVLGAFTTFSTFGYETVALARDGHWSSALTNVALNVVVGLAAVVAGIAAMNRLSA